MRLNPDSRKAHRFLAKAEDIYGNYRRPFSTSLGRSIWPLRRSSRAVTMRIYVQSLFELRCRIETHWAKWLSAQGSPSATQNALEHIKQAEKDLNNYKKFFTAPPPRSSIQGTRVPANGDRGDADLCRDRDRSSSFPPRPSGILIAPGTRSKVVRSCKIDRSSASK